MFSSEPWTMAYSKKCMKKFFYNKLDKRSTYEMPPNAAAPFQYVSASLVVPSPLCLYHSCVLKETFLFFILSVCHSERFFWAWVDGVIVHDSQTRMDPEKLSKDDIMSFVHQNYQP